jgi:ubiquinone biosynthesis protein
VPLPQRLIEIQRVLVRHGLDEFVRATHLYRPLRFVFLLSPWTWFERRRRPRAASACGSRSRNSGRSS